MAASSPTDSAGSTSLHAAVQSNSIERVQELLQGSADIQLEDDKGRTALHVGSHCGHAEIVETLLESGADAWKTDHEGWTAIEYASFHGHMKIANRLAKAEKSKSETTSTGKSFSTTPPYFNNTAQSSNTSGSSSIESLLPDTNKSVIFFTLGSLNAKHESDPLKLDSKAIERCSSLALENLYLVVSNELGEESKRLNLPLSSDIASQPLIFHTEDPSRASLSVSLIPKNPSKENNVSARGYVLVSSAMPNLGQGLAPLYRELEIPLLEPLSCNLMGTVACSFLLVKPFQHPNTSKPDHKTNWKKIEPAAVIGHRGLGKNTASTDLLQIGENTIPSFLAAHKLGASYVEFDVQVTKDLVPVIYHDFLVGETGIDAPMHTITSEQFLHLKDAETSHLPKAEESHSRSACDLSTSTIPNPSLYNRMSHTRPFKRAHFKANTRGHQISAQFPTLEQLFTTLPLSLGFNIEIKYPMLQEFAIENMPTYHHELNLFVDTILTTVFTHNKNRNVIFSSFNPAICILLSLKQRAIPVLFLTLGGVFHLDDKRCNSLESAMLFAKRWGLFGIVPISGPLVLAPRLIRVVRENGLACISWGPLNNKAEEVKMQVEQGIDGIITDTVPMIKMALDEL